MKVVIVGLGEIGKQTFLMMSKVMFEKLRINPLEHMHGVDLDEKVLKDMDEKGFRVSKETPQDGTTYIISVYTPDQIRSVIEQLPLDKEPLVVIESTLQPGETKKLIEKYPGINLVLFPHRYNPGDPDHHVFNLHRIMGSYNKKALSQAMEFYSNFIEPKNLSIVSPEIAIAEDIKMMCDQYNINFNELRYAMNTKWNIDLKEPRKGIGGKCLPKDCNFINKFFKDNILFDSALAVDNIYRKTLLDNGLDTEDYREV